MKKLSLMLGMLVGGLLFGGAAMLYAATAGIPVTVPSAPGNGYMLLSTSTGAYIATTTDPAHFGSVFATSTATSTFVGGVKTNLLNVTSLTASSTFANGINLTAGCFAINGTCLTSSSGSGTGNVSTSSAETA